MATAKTPAPKAKTAVKQTAKTVETVFDDATRSVMSAFETKNVEVPEMFRSMAENGVSQARENYAQFKAKAEDATDMIEETFETAREGVMTLQHQTLDAAKQNTDAVFDFAKQLMGVTAVADAVQLQAKFAREQFEAFVDYSKDFQSSVTKVAEDAARPAKAALSQTVSSAK